MAEKIRVGLVFGGKSAEHEVSLQSAQSIAAALNKEKYEIIYIGIDKKGRWYLQENNHFLLEGGDVTRVSLKNFDERAVLLPGEEIKELINLRDRSKSRNIDLVFPILHGPLGEDGTVQGLLKLADLPFVGAGVLGSAVGMDKDVMKRLLRDAGMPIGKFLVRQKHQAVQFRETAAQLGLPFFVKPANLGSSVGINCVKGEEDFKRAVGEAFSFDGKILFEEYVKGREIECSVLGNESPAASRCGEIIPQNEFYSYKAKYVDAHGALLKIPADLEPGTEQRIREMAVKTFQVLCCEGLARVDFFLRENGDVLVNEINTLPGFTRISMYPKLWEVSGLPYSELLDRLITLALERYNREKQLKTSVK